mmetsp:Transcript_88969/g.176988  ORF Transcript_88969/g.176988 Transcript_88969/m.176988 type:complete len:214 (-) Transcript_88969:2371-3012(-)
MSVRASTSRCNFLTSPSRVSDSLRNFAVTSLRSCCNTRVLAPAASAAARARFATSLQSRWSICRAASSVSTSPRRATCTCSSCKRPFCSASCVRNCSCCLERRSRCVRTESSSRPSSTSCSCKVRSWSLSAWRETFELAPSNLASLARAPARRSSTLRTIRCSAEASVRRFCNSCTFSSIRLMPCISGSRAACATLASSEKCPVSFCLRGMST